MRWPGNGRYVRVDSAISGIRTTPNHQPPGAYGVRVALQYAIAQNPSTERGRPTHTPVISTGLTMLRAWRTETAIRIDAHSAIARTWFHGCGNRPASL